MTANDMGDMSGQTVRIFELVKFLSAYYSVNLATFQKPPNNLNPYIFKWFSLGRRLGLDDFGSIFGVFQLIKLIILMRKAINFSDHKVFYTDSFYLLFLTKIIRIPTIFELHGIATKELVSKGKLPRFSPITMFFNNLFNWLYSLPKLVITVTINLKLEYIRRTRKNNCVVIPNGVDVDRFIPITESDRLKVKKKYFICNNCLPIVYVSGMRPWHGLPDLLIELNPLLKKKSFQLYFVGEGPDLLKAKKRVKELCLNNEVHFLGSIHHSTVQEVMAISIFGLYFYGYDPFIIEHFDNIGHNPIKILEYMAVGVPVIVPNVTGLSNLIKKSSAGWIYDPKPGKLLDIVKIIFKNKEELRERGKKGRKYVMENFRWDQAAQQISLAINRLIANTF
ncbi:MAG: glycosyltransferase [Candidatus Thorarchaeota archaeon]